MHPIQFHFTCSAKNLRVFHQRMVRDFPIRFVRIDMLLGIAWIAGAAFLASQSQRFMENATLLYPQVNSSVANSNISSGTKKEFKKMEYRLKDAMKKFGGANTSLACSSLQPSWYHFRVRLGSNNRPSPSRLYHSTFELFINAGRGLHRCT